MADSIHNPNRAPIPSLLSAAVGSPTVPAPVWHAVASGNIAILQDELDNGYNIEETDVMGRTLLIEAARFNQEECVRELLLRGADPHHTSPSGTADSLTTSEVIYDLIQNAKISSTSDDLDPLDQNFEEDGALEDDIDSDDEEGLIYEPPTPGGSHDHSPTKNENGAYRPQPQARAGQRGGPPAPCIFFQKGYCRNGEACRFSHSIPIVAPSGGPPMGHSVARPPREPREKWELRDTSSIPCKYFMLGACRFGNNCRYSHMTPYATPPESQAGVYDYIPPAQMVVPVESGFVYPGVDMMVPMPPQPWQPHPHMVPHHAHHVYHHPPQAHEQGEPKGYEEGEGY